MLWCAFFWCISIQHIHRRLEEVPPGVMFKALDCGIVVSEWLINNCKAPILVERFPEIFLSKNYHHSLIYTKRKSKVFMKECFLNLTRQAFSVVHVWIGLMRILIKILEVLFQRRRLRSCRYCCMDALLGR